MTNFSNLKVGDTVVKDGNRLWVRPSWDSIWMGLAQELAKRSTCYVPNRSVGCVIVDDRNSRVLSLGYNGGAAGLEDACEYVDPDDIKEGNSRCTCCHAEMNALTKLDFNLDCIKTCYLTLSPCQICAKLLINARIDNVIFIEEYTRGNSIQMLIDAGIAVYQYDTNTETKRRLHFIGDQKARP